MSARLRAFTWLFAGCVALFAVTAAVYLWMEKKAHDDMDSRTLVRISLDREDTLVTSVDLELCGHVTHFIRAELLDTVIRNLPTWEEASKCPVRITCHSDRVASVTHVLDSIEYRGISGEHAFTLGPEGVAYRYWP